MESQRCGDVGGEVGGVVAPGVDVEFVRDSASREDLVEGGSAGLKTVIVLIAAIEVNLQARQFGGTRKLKGAVCIPENRVRRNAENSAENS